MYGFHCGYQFVDIIPWLSRQMYVLHSHDFFVLMSIGVVLYFTFDGNGVIVATIVVVVVVVIVHLHGFVAYK